MATKNKPGAWDYYANANAEPDEPLFVLLARDKHAPALVWLWAAMRELDGETRDKVAEARDCTAAMAEWLIENRGKQPVGIGHAVLCGVMEIITQANAGCANSAASPAFKSTTADALRVILTKINQPENTTNGG